MHGPFKLQAEYMATRVERYRVDSGHFSGTGGYLSGMWNVTGQSWGYKGSEPATLVGSATGAGMWQVGLRYAVLDLNDGIVQGGRMENWTAGVNWYWRSHLKFVLSYVQVDSQRGPIANNPNLTEARVQFYW